MTYKTDKRLCLNADRTLVVDCDSRAACWQLAMPGDEVSDEDVKRYGLNQPEQKAVENAPQNKAVTMPKGKK